MSGDVQGEASRGSKFRMVQGAAFAPSCRHRRRQREKKCNAHSAGGEVPNARPPVAPRDLFGIARADSHVGRSACAITKSGASLTPPQHDRRAAPPI